MPISERFLNLFKKKDSDKEPEKKKSLRDEAKSKSVTDYKDKDEKTGKIPRPPLGEEGATGTKIFSGTIDEEYLTEWNTLSKKCESIDRMLRSDGTVQAVMLAIRLPIMAAHWEVEPGDDSKLAKEAAEFVQNNLLGNELMEHTWEDTLFHIIQSIAYGFYPFELVWKTDEGRVILRKIAPRLPKTIYQWHTDSNGAYDGFTQQALFTGGDKVEWKYVTLKGDKTILFTFQQEGSNFEGNSIFRGAFKHFYYKDKIYLIQGIGLERMAVGEPVITLPEKEDNVTASLVSYLRKVIKSWGSHQESGLLLPFGAVANVSDPKLNHEAIRDAITHHDSQMAKCALAQFMQLGQSGAGGSYALSKDETDFFLMNLNSMAKHIGSTMNRHAIKKLIDYNYGEGVVKYPRLICTQIGAVDKKAMADFLNVVITGRVVNRWGAIDENWARKQLGLQPKKTREIQTDMDKQKAEEQEMQLQQLQMQGGSPYGSPYGGGYPGAYPGYGAPGQEQMQQPGLMQAGQIPQQQMQGYAPQQQQAQGYPQQPGIPQFGERGINNVVIYKLGEETDDSKNARLNAKVNDALRQRLEDELDIKGIDFDIDIASLLQEVFDDITEETKAEVEKIAKAKEKTGERKLSEIELLDEIENETMEFFNPYHDPESGRFANAAFGAAFTLHKKWTQYKNWEKEDPRRGAFITSVRTGLAVAGLALAGRGILKSGFKRGSQFAGDILAGRGMKTGLVNVMRGSPGKFIVPKIMKGKLQVTRKPDSKNVISRLLARFGNKADKVTLDKIVAASGTMPKGEQVASMEHAVTRKVLELIPRKHLMAVNRIRFVNPEDLKASGLKAREMRNLVEGNIFISWNRRTNDIILPIKDILPKVPDGGAKTGILRTPWDEIVSYNTMRKAMARQVGTAVLHNQVDPVTKLKWLNLTRNNLLKFNQDSGNGIASMAQQVFTPRTYRYAVKPINATFKDAAKGLNPLKLRAVGNLANQHFAETYRMYIYNPRWLAKHNPEAFEFMTKYVFKQ